MKTLRHVSMLSCSHIIAIAACVHACMETCNAVARFPSEKPSRLTRALLETAKDMKGAGVLTEPAYEKLTLRHLGKGEASPLFGPPEADRTGAACRKN